VNIAFFRAWLLSQATFAIQASLTWQNFRNEILVHSKEITPNPVYSTQLEFWKLSAKALGLKIFVMILKALEFIHKTIIRLRLGESR